jgi:pimeloyl-ACP methyl ester carboxylesterase
MQELREETLGGTFPFAPHYLEEDGIDLHYIDVGTGAPLTARLGHAGPRPPPTVLARWRATYPRAEVCEIQDASHFLQEDAPENVFDCLTAFLRP